MRQRSDRLSRAIGYPFDDLSRLEQALTHRSAGAVNNERHEFLGDAILGFVIADTLFQRFSEASEGELSRLRAGLVKKETLAQVARELELGSYLNLGAGELRSGGQSRDSILADALEAILAAVYLDGGYSAAHRVVLTLFQQRIEELPAGAREKDPKTRLQEYLQSGRQPLPRYSIEKISGEQHQQRFEVECRVNGIDLVSRGTGDSRRKAEQASARRFLEMMMAGKGKQVKHG